MKNKIFLIFNLENIIIFVLHKQIENLQKMRVICSSNFIKIASVSMIIDYSYFSLLPYYYFCILRTIFYLIQIQWCRYIPI